MKERKKHRNLCVFMYKEIFYIFGKIIFSKKKKQKKIKKRIQNQFK